MTTGIRLLPADASEQQWLAARRAGIGASEIAAVAGLSRRRGPWDVWSSKVEGTEWEGNDVSRWGQFIESRIVDWWARETGRWVGPGGLFRHPVHEWLIATPDAVVYEPGTDLIGGDVQSRVQAVVDAKNAGWYMAGDWDEDGAPIDYVCQITWQMLAVGVTSGYLVAAIGGKPPVERSFELDDDLAAELINRGAAFWQLVESRTPPPLDGSDSAAAWVKHRYTDANPDLLVDLDDDDTARLAELVALEHRITDLETAKKAVQNAIKERLGTAETGTYKGRTYVTWKTVNKRGFEVKPTTFRKFYVPDAIKKELSPDGLHE
jgi:putative phage-type endonuclease